MRAIEPRQDKLLTHMLCYVGDQHNLAASAMEDEYGNNLLHIVAGLAPLAKLNRIPEAALQMRRELHGLSDLKFSKVSIPPAELI
ncbi:hypothetical protein TIFTF001_044264 [Ficus carica]|uniref:Uncharacterized protein n=1 Tax=Ficus carica TaxID=3494 RepID=A0AA87Z2L8_FICCA|nr:hypothetical protein TIFTF001_044264 [Ficus carica]